MASPRRLPLTIVASLAASAAAMAQMPRPAEHPAIAYSATAPNDAIAHLQQRIDSGAATLEWDDAHGYLPSVLSQLAMPVSSQSLVFSRTSLQVDRIAPWTPRAVYFSDDVYLGWVQEGPIMEIASADPQLGAVFYTLRQERQAKPHFERQTQTCLACHDSASVTGGVPGFIVRSVFPDRYGYAIAPVGEGSTTDRTPVEDRWGGWYVTGAQGGPRHLGNVLAPALTHEVANAPSALAKLKQTATGSAPDLAGRFDVSPYLAPSSDVVALMTLAHQASIHNLMTSAAYETRRALDDEDAAQRIKGGAPLSGHLDLTMMRIRGAADRLVRGLLFVKASPLAGPVKGSSSFVSDFTARGPRDHLGRSLRDFDLNGRLFRYALSYLIYSEQFDALPPQVQAEVYRRLHEVLGGDDQSPDFAHLTEADRKSITEILDDTKPGWRAPAASPTGFFPTGPAK
jgi:hypothetical protein